MFLTLFVAGYFLNDMAESIGQGGAERGLVAGVGVAYFSTITVVSPSVTIPALPSLIAFAASRWARSPAAFIRESSLSVPALIAARPIMFRSVGLLGAGLSVIWSTPCRDDLGLG